MEFRTFRLVKYKQVNFGYKKYHLSSGKLHWNKRVSACFCSNPIADFFFCCDLILSFVDNYAVKCREKDV